MHRNNKVIYLYYYDNLDKSGIKSNKNQYFLKIHKNDLYFQCQTIKLNFMQVFVPYNDAYQTAMILYADKRRFHKQIVECNKIIDAIEGKKSGWKNHPIVKMYKNHVDWLKLYVKIFKYLDYFINAQYEIDKISFYNGLLVLRELARNCAPDFLTNEFCDQHKRRLFTKNEKAFGLFKDYGKSYENWYFDDGKILKYKQPIK